MQKVRGVGPQVAGMRIEAAGKLESCPSGGQGHREGPRCDPSKWLEKSLIYG